MAEKISFMPGNKWRGGGIIPPDLRTITNLSSWSNIFIKHFKNIGKQYDTYRVNDGELVGQEKANLILLLENLLAGLFVFRDYILSLTDKAEVRRQILDQTICAVKIDATVWSGHGTIPANAKNIGQDFADQYNKTLLPGVKGLFAAYGEAAKDKIFSDAEISGNIQTIDSLASEILITIQALSSRELSR
ncbi:MAG: hypothetical protein EHM28_13005 [Spirochaetaceae bacterium]|nr:MAG: hypothetical protein EHM28_13005 [Spirochaetaceae bacterium]